MRVICPECSSKSRITNRNQLSLEVSDLYCQCANVHCGHTFVAKLAFSHSINPPKNKVNELIFDYLKNMDKQARKQLLDNVDRFDHLRVG